MIGKEQYISREITIRGLVQGVGFRPFVYRLAGRHRLTGWVENRNDAVHLLVQGSERDVNCFIENLYREKPAIAYVTDMQVDETDLPRSGDFGIRWSRDDGDEVTEISPDIAVCDQCLHDMEVQPHRIDYPFINCTHCGPRFTIIRDLPYDRSRTTMTAFPMCEVCDHEYNDIDNRRFHAQPVACNHCGPSYSLTGKSQPGTDDIHLILTKTAALIDNGGVIIAKGLGGFFLACDALNERAVNKLRKIKRRYTKPFAVMFRDAVSLKEFAEVNYTEEKALTSWQRPVVILKALKPVAPSVSVGFPTIGALLPYLPLHYLLFRKLGTPAVVFTSGNFSEEPIMIDDTLARAEFGKRLDAVLDSNRPIYNRADDSVGQVVNDDLRLLRRSRGYVPAPVFFNDNTEGLLAAGAELVNCFCIGKDRRAILSQHIGDLKNYETLEFYEESFSRFLRLFRVTPKAIACDLHPDYLSTRYARSLDIPVLEVQHHHAHIASCMAENGINEKVIGVSMDGTGLGKDGQIWGSEFMVCDLRDFKRITHFDYKAMPGGDKAIEKPWRMALSYLFASANDAVRNHAFRFLRELQENEIEMVIQAIQNRVNCPLSSGAGRLFDTVAVLLGLLTESGFHAEAPMRLEAIADRSEEGSYPYESGETLKFDTTLLAILEEIRKGVNVSVISARFHNTIIGVITDTCSVIRESGENMKVVLSGGTFQNKYLLTKLEYRLKELNFKFYSQKQVPCNDGGIALGQLAVLAKKQNELCV